MRRRHGWQLPLHPLQIIGIAMYVFLIVAFYTFVGPFIGNRVAENTVITLFTFTAFTVMILFVRCTVIDPSDKTSLKKKRTVTSNGLSQLSYRFIASQIMFRVLRRIEKKILKCFIKRRYLQPLQDSFQMESLLPFPFIAKDDAILPDIKDDDTMYCSLCDFQVKTNSKHCRSCDRCVDGFDHHCRWLNNCIGRKNYTTFILLIVFALLMLLIEGGAAITIFVRSFADKSGISKELEHKLSEKFPRGVIAAISVLLTLMTAYGTVALGQLFIFHIVLIKKGLQTYDYILAMKEENQSMELWDDSSTSSDESIDDLGSPEKSTSISRLICRGNEIDESSRRLSIRIDRDDATSPTSSKKPEFHISINPWRLIKMSKEKALSAAAKAKERMAKGKQMAGHEEVPEALLQPLPTETKRGPSANFDKKNLYAEMTPVVAKGWFAGNNGRFSSPRRRISGSPTTVTPSPKQKHRSNFDLKLTQVSQELETYISQQALCSVLKKGGEDSPR